MISNPNSVITLTSSDLTLLLLHAAKKACAAEDELILECLEKFPADTPLSTVITTLRTVLEKMEAKCSDSVLRQLAQEVMDTLVPEEGLNAD